MADYQKVIHNACGQEVLRDEWGFVKPDGSPDEHHEKGHCRPNSAHHAQVEKPRSTWKLGRTGAGGGR